MENKTSKFEASSLEHSNEHHDCSKHCSHQWHIILGLTVCGKWYWKVGIKYNLLEVRCKQKMLTLVISGCFIWLIQNYWVPDMDIAQTQPFCWLGQSLSWCPSFLPQRIHFWTYLSWNSRQARDQLKIRSSENTLPLNTPRETVQTWGCSGGPNDG